MKTINENVRRFFAFGAGSAMALVFGVIFVNATRRYTVGKSIAWGEELPIYLTIYGVMFGIAYAYLSDSHIRFSVLLDMVPARLRHWLLALTDVITAATGVTLAVAGHAFALRRGHLDSSGLQAAADGLAEFFGLPILEWIGKVGTWQYAIAIGGVLLSIAALLRLIERLATSDGEGAQ